MRVLQLFLCILHVYHNIPIFISCINWIKRIWATTSLLAALVFCFFTTFNTTLFFRHEHTLSLLYFALLISIVTAQPTS
jgi:hypothetical protein